MTFLRVALVGCGLISEAHIRAYQSTLVVKAPPYIHRQISGTIEAERPLSSPGK